MRKKPFFFLIWIFFVAVSFSQSITVTNPHGGENWVIGNTYTITWNSSGISGTVGIKLFQNGRSLGYIAQDVPNTGTYRWTIGSIIGVGPISAGAHYQIQVKKSGVAAGLSAGEFTISNPPAASITVTNPHGGENWVIGNTYTIRWNSRGISGTVGIKLFQNGSSLGYIAQDVPNTGSYSWTIGNIIGVGPISAGAHYQIQVKKSGVAAGLSSGEFTITNPSPVSKTITVTYPNGGERIGAPGNIEIRWSSTGSISNVKILATGSSGTLTVADSVPNTGSYTVSIPDDVNNGNYKIKIVDVSDSSVYDESDRTFTLYHPAGDPYIRITNPSGGESLELESRTEIRWESGRFDGFVKIELWKDEGLSERKIGTITERVKSSPFVWNVGDFMGGTASAGDNYYIIISSLNVSGLKAASRMFSIVSHPSPSPSGSITITTPYRGLKWFIGSPYAIEWNKRGDVGSNVRIKLMQGERKILTIVDSTENDGEYIYTPTSVITPGIYHIRIESIDRSVSANSELFEIKEPVTTFEVRKPASGDKWYKNQTYSIEWGEYGSARIDKVKIKLMQGNTQKYLITNSTENDGFYRWTIPDSINEGTYSIKVESLDGSVSGKSENFSIKNPYSGGTNNRFMSRREHYNSSLKNLDFSIKGKPIYDHSKEQISYKVSSSVPYTGRINYVLFIESTDVSRMRTTKLTGNIDFNGETEKNVLIKTDFLKGIAPWCYRFSFAVNDKQAGQNIVSERTKFNNHQETTICYPVTRYVIVENVKIKIYKNGSSFWKYVRRGSTVTIPANDCSSDSIRVELRGVIKNYSTQDVEVSEFRLIPVGGNNHYYDINPKTFHLKGTKSKSFKVSGLFNVNSTTRELQLVISYYYGMRDSFSFKIKKKCGGD